MLYCFKNNFLFHCLIGLLVASTTALLNIRFWVRFPSWTKCYWVYISKFSVAVTSVSLCPVDAKGSPPITWDLKT